MYLYLQLDEPELNPTDLQVQIRKFAGEALAQLPGKLWVHSRLKLTARTLTEVAQT